MSVSPSPSLRIAIVAPPWFEIPPNAYGGIEWICAWLADGLLARGHDVTLIAAGTNRTGARFLQTFPRCPSERLGDGLPDVIHTAMAERLLQDLDVDLVHDHTLCGPLQAGRRAIPTFVTAHGPLAGDIGDYYRALGNAVNLVSISGSQRAEAPELNWAATVHNGIPPRFRNAPGSLVHHRQLRFRPSAAREETRGHRTGAERPGMGCEALPGARRRDA